MPELPEVECGVGGGEEDGLRVQGQRERLYTTTADLLRVAEGSLLL